MTILLYVAVLRWLYYAMDYAEIRIPLTFSIRLVSLCEMVFVWYLLLQEVAGEYL
jgi:hypothetical protein